MKCSLYVLLSLSLAVVMGCGDEDWKRPEPRVATGPQTAGTPTTGTPMPNSGNGTGTQTQTPTTQNQTPLPPGTTPPPQTPAVTYVAFVQPLVMRSCLGAGCHNAASPAAAIALDTQANLRTNFPRAIQSIDAKRMPVASRTPLTADEIAKLKQWQAANFP